MKSPYFCLFVCFFIVCFFLVLVIFFFCYFAGKKTHKFQVYKQSLLKHTSMRKDKKYAIVKMYFSLYILSRFSRSHKLPSFSICLVTFDSSTSGSSSSKISLLEPLLLSRLFQDAPFSVSLPNPVPSIYEARPDLAYSHINCFSW